MLTVLAGKNDRNTNIVGLISTNNMDEDIEKLLESAEPVEAGMTNEVWDAGDVMVKKYSKQAPLALALTAFKIPEGRLEYPSREQRMENERTAEKYFSDRDLTAPEIEMSDSDCMVFDKVSGDSFSEIVEEIDEDEAYEVARKAGHVTAEMHEDDCARRDHRPENLMLDIEEDDLELHLIDNEYFTDEASEMDKKADVITFLSEAKTYSPDKYREVREGFENGYGRDIGRFESVIASGTTLGRIAVVDRDGQKLANYLNNL